MNPTQKRLSEGGKKGGKQKGINNEVKRLELAIELSKLVSHHSELVAMLKERPTVWLKAKIAELRQHKNG